MMSSKLLNTLYNFVIFTSNKYGIDESHSLGHSMDVFGLANNIYQSELVKNPYIKDHENIIATSSILHDMIDRKYMNKNDGIIMIKDYMKDKISNEELDISLQIMDTMSYSVVKKNGFPNLGTYQLAYNIVREADLLASYEFDRAVMYKMYKYNDNYIDAYHDSLTLFKNRVLKYREDKLFTTSYAKTESLKLQMKAIRKMNNLARIIL